LRPVVIVRHATTEGPAFFGTWLTANGIDWREVRIDQGDSLPIEASGMAGLGFMGGPMSVNDPLPWIPQALDLICDASRLGVPVIGHCLGGQIMCRAFGGEVTLNRHQGQPAKEIGWHRVTPTATPEARDWFGTEEPLDVFQWHGETFGIPPGATRLATSERCPNQAFAIGPHIAMQFHIEMDEPTIEAWYGSGAPEVAEALAGPRPQGIQTAEEVQALTPERLPRMRQLTDRIYRHWAEGLARV
jgi:GMP synthase-like glutamine amidotransferase